MENVIVEAPKTLTSAALLAESHPLHKAFIAFCGENKPTKRQAAKFLQKYPQFRRISKS